LYDAADNLRLFYPTKLTVIFTANCLLSIIPFRFYINNTLIEELSGN